MLSVMGASYQHTVDFGQVLRLDAATTRLIHKTSKLVEERPANQGRHNPPGPLRRTYVGGECRAIICGPKFPCVLPSEKIYRAREISGSFSVTA